MNHIKRISTGILLLYITNALFIITGIFNFEIIAVFALSVEIISLGILASSRGSVKLYISFLFSMISLGLYIIYQLVLSDVITGFYGASSISQFAKEMMIYIPQSVCLILMCRALTEMFSSYGYKQAETAGRFSTKFVLVCCILLIVISITNVVLAFTNAESNFFGAAVMLMGLFILISPFIKIIISFVLVYFLRQCKKALLNRDV